MSKKMVTKILTALALIAVVLPPILLGGIWICVLLALVSLGAGYEIAMLVDRKPHYLMTILNFVAIMTICFVPETHVAAVEALWLIILFVIELVDEKITTDSVVYPFALTSLVGLAMRCVVVIYSIPQFSAWMLLFVLLGCFVCDTGAYFCGVTFGKHKMIPRVSPNKTWEGSIGGFVCGFIAAFVYGILVLKDVPFLLILVASILLPIVAQVGDLSFSSIKRRFDVKDFSDIFPGHGGFLDRVDSLVFCLMVFHSLLIIWGIVI